MLQITVISAFILLASWSLDAFAFGFEESELRKYIENLRKSELRASGTAESKEQSPSGIVRIIEILDEDEPNIQELEKEIVGLPSAAKAGQRHYLIARYALAVSYQKTGQFEKAAEVSAAALEGRVSRDWQYAFSEVFFYAAWELEQFEQIVAQFPKFSRSFGVARKNEKIGVIAYQSYINLGDHKKGIEILEELVRNYPATEHARYAFQRLVDLTCESDLQKRYVFSQRILVQLSRNNELPNGVREFVLASIDSPMVMENGSVRRLMDYEKTDFLFKTRMYDEALTHLRDQYELKRHNSNDPEVPDLMFGMARALMRQQDYKRAATFASRFLAQYPEHGLRTNMKEILADSLRYLNIATTASTLYQELSQVSTSDHFRWQTFWTLYMGRKYEEALTALRRPETRASGARIGDDGILYWEANLLEKIGKEKEAREKYAQLLNTYPNSFYSSYLQMVRAKLKTEVVDKNVNSDAELGISNEGVILASIEGNKTAATSDIENLGPNRLADVISFAEDLADKGKDELARLFLSEVDARNVSDWATYKGLADISFKLGNFVPTRNIRYKKFSPIRDIPGDWRGFNNHIKNNEKHWKVYFPNAYDQFVGAVAETFNRSRFLILSIMRAESFYNNEARSPVGAIGLMQMMPYTAIKIANLVKDFDFKMTDLTKPAYSIGYGGYYIDKLQRYYQENPILAVAAYNAGPKAVNQWIESCRQCSMDEFVESIPYRETRNYVKKVISYFFNYFRVYESGVPSFQNLRLPEYFPESEEIF